MSYTATCDHEGGQVELEFEGVDFHSGNRRTRHYPGDSASVEGFSSCKIVWDELDRELDPEFVWEAHDEELAEQLLRKKGEREDPRNRNMPGDWRGRRRAH